MIMIGIVLLCHQDKSYEITISPYPIGVAADYGERDDTIDWIERGYLYLYDSYENLIYPDTSTVHPNGSMSVEYASSDSSDLEIIYVSASGYDSTDSGHYYLDVNIL